MDKLTIDIDQYGSVSFRRPCRGGTIVMQRLQFSSNLGIAFCVSAGRVPQAIIYE